MSNKTSDHLLPRLDTFSPYDEFAEQTNSLQENRLLLFNLRYLYD